MIEKSKILVRAILLGATGSAPRSGSRVVELRSHIAGIRPVVAASRDQDLTAGQQGRRHVEASSVEIAGVAPTRSNCLCRGDSCWSQHQGGHTNQTGEGQHRTNVMSSVVSLILHTSPLYSLCTSRISFYLVLHLLTRKPQTNPHSHRSINAALLPHCALAETAKAPTRTIIPIIV